MDLYVWLPVTGVRCAHNVPLAYCSGNVWVVGVAYSCDGCGVRGDIVLPTLYRESIGGAVSHVPLGALASCCDTHIPASLQRLDLVPVVVCDCDTNHAKSDASRPIQ